MMQDTAIVITALSFLHLVAVLITIDDLVKVSKRKGKFGWGVLVASIPIIGITLYHFTKRRGGRKIANQTRRV